MGTSHTFKALKEHADKQVKFKQGVHIESCWDGKVLSKPVYLEAQAGICPALALAWLEEKATNRSFFKRITTKSAFSRSKFTSASKHKGHQATTATAAKRFFHYRPEMKAEGKTMQERYEWLAGEYNLTIGTANAGTRDEAIAAAKKMAVGDAYFWNMQLALADGDVSAHATAVTRTKSGFEYFDCNCGGYLIKKYDTFFSTYFGILSGSLKWDVPTIFYHAVSKA